MGRRMMIYRPAEACNPRWSAKIKNKAFLFSVKFHDLLTGFQTLPAGFEALPASSEIILAGSKALLAVSKTLPAGYEAFPASSNVKSGREL